MGQSIQEWTKWNLWKSADHITSNLLKAVFHKFHLVHSWMLCPKYGLSEKSERYCESDSEMVVINEKDPQTGQNNILYDKKIFVNN